MVFLLSPHPLAVPAPLLLTVASAAVQSQHTVCGVLLVPGGWWQCQQHVDSSRVQPQAQKLGNCRSPVGEGQSIALHPNSWLGLASSCRNSSNGSCRCLQEA